MKYYYLIRTTYNEYEARYVKICESFEEAVSEVPNYADWYCNKGTCKIVKVDSNFRQLECWQYWNGELENHQKYICS
mgnify:CR=1 FL=1